MRSDRLKSSVLYRSGNTRRYVYQISKEHERIQEESANREGAIDINTRVYKNVKNT